MNAPEPRQAQPSVATSPSAVQAPAPVASSRSSAVTAQAPSGPIQTDVGQRARQLREEAQRLLNSVVARGNTVQQIRGQAVQHVQGYQSTAGTINARLAVGTTVGNPILQQQWVQASEQLDLIGGDVSRLSGLIGEAGADSNASQAALQQIARTFAMPGAIEDDHRFLVNAEDDINRAIVLNNRQIGEINSDMVRLNTYVSRERPNLAQLSQAINAGQLGGSSGSQFTPSSRAVVEESRTQPRSFSSGRASAPPPRSSANTRVSTTAPSRTSASRGSSRAAPTRAAAEPASAARRPLVVIRFDRPNPAYEQPLYTAVSRALERKPNVTFDLVAMAPSGGRQAAGSLARARTQAQQVMRTLTDMGLPSNRVSVSTTASPSIAANEVHLFVR